MAVPGENHKKQLPQTKITASDIKEYVYCPRAWIYRMRGIRPELPREGIEEVEQRLLEGRRFHRDHGEAVCRAARQQRQAVNWRYIGLAAAGLAFLLLIWRQ